MTDQSRFIDRTTIPNWALKRACEITGCGWTINDLRTLPLRDSYTHTIWKVAKYVHETEEKPADRLTDAIHAGLVDGLAPARLKHISGWPGTWTLAVKVAKAIRESGLTPEDISGKGFLFDE